MNIQAIRWARVEIKYAEKCTVGRGVGPAIFDSDIFTDALVTFENNTLRIQETIGDRNRSILLGRARLVSLTPYNAQLDAYWLLLGVGGKTVPATIVCTF